MERGGVDLGKVAVNGMGEDSCLSSSDQACITLSCVRCALPEPMRLCAQLPRHHPCPSHCARSISNTSASAEPRLLRLHLRPTNSSRSRDLVTKKNRSQIEHQLINDTRKLRRNAKYWELRMKEPEDWWGIVCKRWIARRGGCM